MKTLILASFAVVQDGKELQPCIFNKHFRKRLVRYLRFDSLRGLIKINKPMENTVKITLSEYERMKKEIHSLKVKVERKTIISHSYDCLFSVCVFCAVIIWSIISHPQWFN